MNSLRWYIEKNVLFIFFACEILLTSAVLGIDLSEHIQLFQGASGETVFRYYISLTAVALTLLAPLSLGLSHSITFLLFKKRGELAGMMSTGFSPANLLEFTRRVRLGILALMFLSIEYVLPPSLNSILNTWNAEKSYQVKEGKPGIFFLGDTLIIAGRVEYENKQLSKVIVIKGYQYETPLKVFSAEKGIIQPEGLFFPQGRNFITGESQKLFLKAEVEDALAGQKGVLVSLANSSLEIMSPLLEYPFIKAIFSRYMVFLLFRILLLASVITVSTGAVLSSLRSAVFSPSDFIGSLGGTFLAFIFLSLSLWLMVISVAYGTGVKLLLWSASTLSLLLSARTEVAVEKIFKFLSGFGRKIPVLVK